MFNPIIELPKFKKIKIIQIGCGGNGGYLCQKVSRTINVSKKTIHYLLVDEDTVEEKNLLRQPFIIDDVGENKAAVLSERYGAAYSINLTYKDKYIINKEQLLELVDDESFTLIIGAVDNNASRQILHNFFLSQDNICYIDAGIDGVFGETPEEVFESGYTGQVVCGLRLDGETILEDVGGVYEDVLTDKDSVLPGLACGQTVVNHPQRMQTNEIAALIMQSYVQNILFDDVIVSHYTNFNALTMRSQPTWIKK